MSHKNNSFTIALALIKIWVQIAWNSVFPCIIPRFKILNSAMSSRTFESISVKQKKIMCLKKLKKTSYTNRCAIHFDLNCAFYFLRHFSPLQEKFSNFVLHFFWLTRQVSRAACLLYLFYFHSNIILFSVLFSTPPLVYRTIFRTVSLLQTNLWLQCSWSGILRIIGQRVQCHQHHRTKPY